MKFDGHKRARLVAGGHMTPKLNTEDTYSSIISLDTIKLAFLAGELQDLKYMKGEISSAYFKPIQKSLFTPLLDLSLDLMLAKSCWSTRPYMDSKLPEMNGMQNWLTTVTQ